MRIRAVAILFTASAAAAFPLRPNRQSRIKRHSLNSCHRRRELSLRNVLSRRSPWRTKRGRRLKC